MRLQKISRQKVFSNGALTIIILVKFVINGVSVSLPLTPPVNWDTMTRAEKITWGKGQVTTYLTNNIPTEPDEVLFPDNSAQEAAADNFENLPGWATWTASEAEAWINTNVTTLATAKVALVAMAKAIVYLRNITIPQ